MDMAIPNGPEICSRNMKVRCYEQDAAGRLRPGEVFNWFQEAASEHCRMNNVAIEDIIPRGFTWVIHRYKVVVHRMPRYGEEYKIATWAQPRRDLISVREFAAEDLKGERYLSATTQWALIDLSTQRPTRLSTVMANFPACQQRALDEDLKPVIIPEDLSVTSETEMSVTPWGIDKNNHVNNSVYVFWMYDNVFPHIKKTPAMREIEVNYRKQAFYGQKVLCKGYAAPGGVFYHNIMLKETGETLVLIRSVWSEKD